MGLYRHAREACAGSGSSSLTQMPLSFKSMLVAVLIFTTAELIAGLSSFTYILAMILALPIRIFGFGDSGFDCYIACGLTTQGWLSGIIFYAIFGTLIGIGLEKYRKRKNANS